MSQESPGRELSYRIGQTSLYWDAVYRFHADKAPWHQVVSQIIAVIGDRPDDVLFVDAIVSNERELSALTLDLILLTKDLVLISSLEAGGKPELKVLVRRGLSAMSVREAPLVTHGGLNGQWDTLRVDLTYPTDEISLPFNADSTDRSAELMVLLPSLVADLKERG